MAKFGINNVLCVHNAFGPSPKTQSSTSSKEENIVNTIFMFYSHRAASNVANSSLVRVTKHIDGILSSTNFYLYLGRVIKANNSNWHPNCFKCELCSDILTDKGFFKNAGRALCGPCNDKEKAAAVGKYVCFKCRAIIDEGAPLKFKVFTLHLC